MKRTMTAMAIAALTAGATILGLPGSASAHSDHWVYTTDGDPGGKAKFQSNGDTLVVCDIEADGWAALGRIYTLGGSLVFTEQAGTNGNCDAQAKNLPERTWYVMKICLKQGDRIDFCRNHNVYTGPGSG